MTWQPLLALPARLLAPLLLAVLASLAIGVNHYLLVRDLEASVVQEETRRLRERLGLEQSRLEIQFGLDNPQQVRRLVSALALHEGISHAWLVEHEGRVVGALARTQIGQDWPTLLARETPALAEAARQAQASNDLTPRIVPIQAGQALLGTVPVGRRHHLLVRMDLAVAQTQRKFEARGQLRREAASVGLFVLLLAALLHALWFRRAARLTATATALGTGQLDARARLGGRDELAAIGAALDAMADRHQHQQIELRRLADLIRHSPVVAFTWLAQPGWPVSYVSENVEDWGYRREDFLSGQLHYIDLVHPDDRTWLEADVADHLAHGPDHYRQEYRLKRLDGGWRWVDDRTWLTRDAQGAVTAIHGLISDNTEYHRVATQAIESAAALRAIFEGVHEGILVVDLADTRVVMANPALCTMLGQDEAALIEQPAEHLHPEAARASLRERYAAMAQGQFEAPPLLSLRGPNDSVWLAEASVAPISLSGRACVLWVLRDVTERARTEAALAESEARHRYLFEHNPVPMLIYERHSLRLVAVNEAFLSHYGYDPEEALALRLPDLHPQQEKPAIIALARELHGLAEAGEWHHRRKDGDYIHVVAHAHDLMHEGRACQVVVLTDITALKRAEQDLRQRNSELEQFNEASIGRELRMIELKREINALASELGRPAPYALDFAEPPAEAPKP
ncbi:MAG: PAS domain S-box protein [Pseudomonadota bacterium]